jgi:modification methylase
VNEFLNKIICGSCLDILPKIPNDSIHLVITSPPYSNLKKYSDKEKDLGNLDIVNQKPFFMKVFKEIHRILKNGRKFVLFYSDVICKDKDGVYVVSPTYYFTPDILNLGFKLRNTFIWRKPGSFSKMKKSKPFPPSPVIQSYFEYIFVFQKNGKVDLSYVKEEDRKRSIIPMKLVTSQSGVFSFSNDMKLKKIHPAIFPVDLIKILIMMYSFVNDIVLDPFNGIGTTCIASKMLNRNYIGIDINEEYCKIAEERLSKTVSEVNKIQDWIEQMRKSRGLKQYTLF